MEAFYSKYKILLLTILLLLTVTFESCKKLVNVNPPITSTTGASVYNSDASATSVLTGLYAHMSQGGLATGSSSISLLSGLYADEFSLYSGISNTDHKYYYYTDSLFAARTDNPGDESWSDFYRYIYISNSAIEGLNQATNLTSSVKQQLLGEAKFIRAFLYFYLVNLYGPVPLAVSSDYNVNARLSRASVAQIFQQITADLLDAEELLSDKYLGSDIKSVTSDRIRPTKWAATALLARTYLYTGDYVNAETKATEVINNTSLYSLNSLNGAFLKNSGEAIWQLQPVNTGWNTEDARLFILPASGPDASLHPVFLSPQLLTSFEGGDQRRINWIDSVIVNGKTYYYPLKYKSATFNSPVSEYEMVLRLAEQYLIRCEARTQNNNINGAQSDLNAIRTRAGLNNTTANDKMSLIAAILHERRIELFSEWGHRWLDLKRTGNIDATMNVISPQKGGTWSSFKQLYPILLSDILLNPNLVQNPGY